MVELLSPSGDFESFMQALYNGADAIYLAGERFGARAYAKNFSIEELSLALSYAHSKGKKIFVTVNTIIKENEYEDAIKYLNLLYEIGVDGVILQDYSLITYTVNNLKPMECHISTQAGVKDLHDVKFFEELGVERCVLARETSIDTIKEIKAKCKMDLETFVYGALCVSFSGGCLFSSLLSLRSGNRGRCSQNCRREYSLYKNGEFIDKGFYLSMKDLNTYNDIAKIIPYVDSLKIEGRMKEPSYVKTITSEYRKKLDNLSYKSNKLDLVFHRDYTKGFILNEDPGNIVNITKKSNQGAYIGKITKIDKNLTQIEIKRELSVGDRIRVVDNEDYYFTVDKLYDKNKKPIKSGIGLLYVEIYNKKNINSSIYKMNDSSIDLTIPDDAKYPLTFDIYGDIDSKLIISTNIDDNYFQAESNMLIQQAKTQGLDYNTLYKQLSKLNDTPFYLKDLNLMIPDNLFITVSEINELRRKIVKDLLEYFSNKRNKIEKTKIIELKNKEYNYPELIVVCRTKEQYDTLKELNVKNIYFENRSLYVNSTYPNYDDILVSSYGGLEYYKGKNIVTDYSFNIINSEGVSSLLNSGANLVTLSVESSLSNTRELYYSFFKKYGFIPPLAYIVYGKMNLMTMKYCPLKRYGECGKCRNNTYTLKDEFGEFILYNDNCINHIVNKKPLNLIDDLDEIKKYIKTLRIDFTTENSDEVKSVIDMFNKKISGDNTKRFDSSNDTRGLFKREIL